MHKNKIATVPFGHSGMKVTEVPLDQLKEMVASGIYSDYPFFVGQAMDRLKEAGMLPSDEVASHDAEPPVMESAPEPEAPQEESEQPQPVKAGKRKKC